MSANVVNLAVVDGQTITQAVELSSAKNGQSLRIKAVQAGKYVLAETASDVAPGNITIKRIGKDLHVFLEDDNSDQPQLIIEGFEGSGGQLVGVTENGSYHEYISSHAEQGRTAESLIEGVEVSQVLSPQPLAGVGDGLSAGAGIDWFRPALLGLAALGALGGVYAATRKKDDGGSDHGPSAADAGNQDKGTIAGADDNVGSKQGLIESGGLTDDRAPTLAGVGRPGSSVEILDNGKTIGTASVGEDGKWSFTPLEPGLDDGQHGIVIVPIDASGNKGEPSPEYVIIVDTVAPSRPLIESIDEDAAPQVGQIGSDGSTHDTTPTLNGTAEPNSIIHIFDNGLQIGSALAGSEGQWSFTPDPALIEGAHEFTITAQDAAGNISPPSLPFQITVDVMVLDKPEAGAGGIDDVISEGDADQSIITDGGFTDNNKPTLKGSGGEPGDTVVVLIDGDDVGTATVGGDGRWAFTPDFALEEGSREIVVFIRNSAGHESERSDPRTIIVDTLAPAAPVLNAVVDDQGIATGELFSGQNTDDASPQLSGTAEPGSLVIIHDNGSPIGSTIATDGSWTFTPSAPLANGPHTLTVTAMDAAGNESLSTPDFDLNVIAGGAPTAPAIITVEDDQGTSRGPLAQNQSTDDAQPTINGTGASGNVITVYANGQALGTTIVDANGQWSFTPNTPLAEGLNNLSAQATDAAGNLSPVTGDYPINVDTVAPGVPVSQVLTDDVGTVVTINPNDVTDDANPTFTGMAEAGSIVMIYDNGNLIGSAAADATTGAWSFTPATALIDGAHSFSAQAVDGAGNVGPMGPAIPFTVDTSAVVISITSVEDNAGTNTSFLTSGQTTDDTTPTLSGQATAGGTVSIYDGATLLGTVIANATGQWTYTTPVLSEGAHDLMATVTTLAEGESEPTSVFQTIIDTNSAGVPVIGDVADNVGAVQSAMVDGSSTDDTTPTLSGSGLPTGDIVRVFDGDDVIGSTIVQADGAWSYTPTTPLNDGSHAFTIVTIDPAGNVSAPSASWSVTIDTSAPIALAVVDSMSKDSGPDTNDFITNDGNAGRLVQGTLLGLLATGEKVQISTDGGESWQDAVMNADNTWSAIDPNSHSQDWAIKTRVIDLAGNVYANSQQVELISRTPDAPDGVSRSGDVVTVDLGVNVAINDFVSVALGGQRFEHRLTADDVTNGKVAITLPAGSAADVVGAAIVSAAGNASQYVGSSIERVETFDGYTAEENISGLLTPLFNTIREVGVLSIGRHFGSTDPSIPGRMSIGSDSLSQNQDVIRFDLTSPSTKVTINLGGDNAGENYFEMFDDNDKSLGTVNVNNSSMAYADYVLNAPENTEISYFRYHSAGEAGGVFIGSITVENRFTAANQSITDHTHYHGTGADDVFLITDLDILDNAESKVSGNEGVDTLRLIATDQTLDLTAMAGALESIEIIDIKGTGDNTLRLSLGDVLEQGQNALFTTDDKTQMMVKGNAGDVVNLDDLLLDGSDPGDWAGAGTAKVAGITYTVFQHSALDAQLLVQDGVTTHLV